MTNKAISYILKRRKREPIYIPLRIQKEKRNIEKEDIWYIKMIIR